MSGYFYLLLSGIQGNNGLSAKMFKTFPKSPMRPVLTFDKTRFAPRAVVCLYEQSYASA